MKMFRMIFRGIRDAFRSVFRNFSLSVASITCITMTLIIVGLSMLAAINVDNIATIIKHDVTMIVYVKEDVTSDKLSLIEEKINQNENVLKCIRKDKNQIKEEMMKSDPFYASTMGTWGDDENPLKDTFQVTVKDIEQIEKTEEELQAIEEIDFVDYGKKMVQTLIDVFRVIEKVAFLVVVSLIIVTIFLIINTIKLTIFSRKREISIMRLVGASNFSIKFPFLVEGMVIGLLGSIIPIIIVIVGYTKAYSHFNGQLFTPLIRLIEPKPFVFFVSLIIIAIGMVVGMFGSYRAVKKYLKV